MADKDNFPDPKPAAEEKPDYGPHRVKKHVVDECTSLEEELREAAAKPSYLLYLLAIWNADAKIKRKKENDDESQ